MAAKCVSVEQLQVVSSLSHRAFFILLTEGTSIGSILGYVLFLNITGLAVKTVRQQSEDFSHMRFMMNESQLPASNKHTAVFPSENNDENSFFSS